MGVTLEDGRPAGCGGRRSGPRTSARRRAVRGHVEERTRAALRTLAELEKGEGVDPSFQTADLGSPAEVGLVSSSVHAMGKPPEDFSPRGAFEELQGVTHYVGMGLKLAPLDIDHLSWSSGAVEPKAVADLIGLGG